MNIDTQALRELASDMAAVCVDGHDFIPDVLEIALLRAAADTIDALRDGIEIHNEALLDTQRWLAARERERDVARAEVARLRDALRKIAACPCRTHHACQKVGMERLRCVTCIARAELGEETDG